MIEKKLYQAAEELPEPSTTFSQIKGRVPQKQNKSIFNIFQSRWGATVLSCALILTIGTVVASVTEVNYSGWVTYTSAFSDVEKKAEKVGITLPYSLDDSPFYQMLTVHVAPEGTTYLEAISNPLYPWYEVNYGIEDVVREDISDETGTGYSEYSVVYDKYQILFGSTENELYKYVFHLDENDTYILDNDPLNQYLTEMYRDINLQITTEVFYDFENNNEIVSYSHEIFWVDDANKAVILIRKPVDVSVTDDIEFPTEMIEFAKEIIDLNIK